LTSWTQVGNIASCATFSQFKTGAGEADRPHRLAVRSHRPHPKSPVLL